jgi:hypothetical protein
VLRSLASDVSVRKETDEGRAYDPRRVTIVSFSIAVKVGTQLIHEGCCATQARRRTAFTGCHPWWGSKTPVRARYYFMHQHRCDEKDEDAQQALLVDTPLV